MLTDVSVELAVSVSRVIIQKSKIRIFHLRKSLKYLVDEYWKINLREMYNLTSYIICLGS